jgi:hypothetical protein
MTYLHPRLHLLGFGLLHVGQQRLDLRRSHPSVPAGSSHRVPRVIIAKTNIFFMSCSSSRDHLNLL